MQSQNRVLVLGASGQMGIAVQRCAPADCEVHAVTSRECDIRNDEALQSIVAEIRPHAIINCAALTHVDNAESELERAFAVNARAPGVLATLARKHSSRLVHISTDYVFDGAIGRPYRTDSPTAPLNTYGRSKRDGELAALQADPNSVVVRTAWVHSAAGRTFVRAVYDAMRANRTMQIVDDQVSTPTRANHLARVLWSIAARSEIRGILHFTDAGVASRYDVAIAVVEALRERGELATSALLIPVPDAAFVAPARRPLYSVLDKHSSWNAIGWTPPHWTEGVIATVKELSSESGREPAAHA